MYFSSGVANELGVVAEEPGVDALQKSQGLPMSWECLLRSRGC